MSFKKMLFLCPKGLIMRANKGLLSQNSPVLLSSIWKNGWMCFLYLHLCFCTAWKPVKEPSPWFMPYSMQYIPLQEPWFGLWRTQHSPMPLVSVLSCTDPKPYRKLSQLFLTGENTGSSHLGPEVTPLMCPWPYGTVQKDIPLQTVSV